MVFQIFYGLAPRDGFEPPTNGLTVRRSTTELPGNRKRRGLSGSRAFKSRKPALNQPFPQARHAPLGAFSHCRGNREPDAAQRVLQRLHTAGEGDAHMVGGAKA